MVFVTDMLNKNYIEELQKEEWFAKLPPSTQASIGIALGEVDRRAREEERKKMREEEDNYNENTLNA